MIGCGRGSSISNGGTATATPVVSAPSAPPPITLELQKMQMVVAGGTSPEYVVSPIGEEGLVQIGIRRLRLINVDIDNLVGVEPDGTLQLQWSYHLNQGLALCREHGWIPHIIIGHVVPPPLAVKAPDGRIYGPSSWTIYDQYIQAFLDYVVVSQGFPETEWEVGNEMNTPSQNWVAPVLPASATDPAGFTAYWTLYSHIAGVVERLPASAPRNSAPRRGARSRNGLGDKICRLRRQPERSGGLRQSACLRQPIDRCWVAG